MSFFVQAPDGEDNKKLAEIFSECGIKEYYLSAVQQDVAIVEEPGTDEQKRILNERGCKIYGDTGFNTAKPS